MLLCCLADALVQRLTRLLIFLLAPLERRQHFKPSQPMTAPRSRSPTPPRAPLPSTPSPAAVTAAIPRGGVKRNGETQRPPSRTRPQPLPARRRASVSPWPRGGTARPGPVAALGRTGRSPAAAPPACLCAAPGGASAPLPPGTAEGAFSARTPEPCPAAGPHRTHHTRSPSLRLTAAILPTPPPPRKACRDRTAPPAGPRAAAALIGQARSRGREGCQRRSPGVWLPLRRLSRSGTAWVGAAAAL